MGYHAGLSAEQAVLRRYQTKGLRILAERWRGSAGELDLVLAEGDGVVVVEVKKSRDFRRAADRLGARQIQRIMATAEEFLGTMPRGSLTDIRFDVALVNGIGEIEIIENALWGH